jgi:hypothetical protein
VDDTLLLGSFSLLAIMIIIGTLSFCIKHGKSFFKINVLVNQNKMIGINNSLLISIGFIIIFFILLSISKVSPQLWILINYIVSDCLFYTL